MVVIILGLPGSGKSYFAARLAKLINATYINSDQLRMELFPTRTYTELEKAEVYKLMLKRMQKVRKSKGNLVLDATFHRHSIREYFMAHCEEKIFFIEIQAHHDILMERLKINRPFSEADYGVYQLIKQQWEPLKQPHLTLHSTNDNIETMLQNALQYLENDKGANR